MELAARKFFFFFKAFLLYGVLLFFYLALKSFGLFFFFWGSLNCVSEILMNFICYMRGLLLLDWLLYDSKLSVNTYWKYDWGILIIAFMVLRFDCF